MAKINLKPFDKMSEDEIIAALEQYRIQNPTKFAAKKEALLKMYGLAPDTKVEVEPDPDLEAAKKKVAKKTTKNKVNGEDNKTDNESE